MIGVWGIVLGLVLVLVPLSATAEDATEQVLEGRWEYLLLPQETEFATMASLDRQLWHNYHFDAPQGFNPDYNTLWLRTKVAPLPSAWKSPVLFVHNRQLQGKLVAYLSDGRRLKASSIISTSLQEALPGGDEVRGYAIGWHSFPVPRFYQGELIFRIDSPLADHVGFDYAPSIVEESKLIRNILFKNFDLSVLASLFFLLSLLVFLIYIRYSIFDSILVFSFGLINLIMAGNLFLLSDLTWFVLPSNGFFHFVNLVFGVFLPFAVWFFINRLLFAERLTLVTFVWRFHLLYAVLALVLVASGWVTYSLAVQGLNYLWLVSMVVGFYYLIAEMRSGVGEAKLLALGGMVFAVSGIDYILRSRGIELVVEHPLIQWGFLVFVFAIAYILIDKFRHANKRLEEFTETLEKRVLERTESLQSSEERYRAVVEAQSELICRSDKDMRIIFVNPAYLKFFDQREEDILGKPCMETIPETEKELVQRAYLNLSKQHPSRTIEHSVMIRNNKVYWLQRNIRAIFNDKDELLEYQSVGRDITARKIAERQLQRNEKQLKEALATNNRFFSIISHDLKNPINSLTSLANFLNDNFENYSRQKLRQSIQNIVSISESISALLRNLLTWSRSQGGNMSVEAEVFDLKDVLTDNQRLFAAAADNKDLTIELPQESGFYVFADRNMVTTVVRNLLSNAIKFSFAGGKVAITLESGQESDRGVIRAHVCDSGVGMEQEQAEKLFAVDRSYSTKGTQGEEGTGLGLVLCHDFVYQNSGRIWAVSAPGEGTCISFSLPRAPKILSQKSESEGESLNATELQQISSLNILLVDDNTINLKISSALLEQHGHRVDTALSGEEALELGQGGTYDLVLMDVEMPGMGGIEAAKQFYERSLNVGGGPTVIAMSSHEEQEIRRRLDVDGNFFAEFLDKPFRYEEFVFKARRKSASHKDTET